MFSLTINKVWHFSLATLMLATPLPALAQNAVLSGRAERFDSSSTCNKSQVRTIVVEKPVYRTVYVKDKRTYWQKHPKVKAATIGAGVGAGAGAVTGLISNRSIVRGAAIGAGTGAAVGLVRSSDTLKRHPIVQDLGTGTLVGLGIGAATGRRGGTAKGAGVGAAVGLGAGLLRHLE